MIDTDQRPDGEPRAQDSPNVADLGEVDTDSTNGTVTLTVIKVSAATIALLDQCLF